MARVLKMKSATPGQPRSRSTKTPDAPVEISVAEIAVEAYALFEARAGGPGDPTADWLEAERIVRARHQPARRRRAPVKPRQSSAS